MSDKEDSEYDAIIKSLALTSAEHPAWKAAWENIIARSKRARRTLTMAETFINAFAELSANVPRIAAVDVDINFAYEEMLLRPWSCRPCFEGLNSDRLIMLEPAAYCVTQVLGISPAFPFGPPTLYPVCYYCRDMVREQNPEQFRAYPAMRITIA